MNGGKSIGISARDEQFDGFAMATLPGHSNSSDISNRIYQDIMNVKSAHRPRSNRPSSTKSTSTQLSFPATPRHSARSKMSESSKQGGFSDIDIIKNRSWSASRVRSSHLGKSGAQRVDAPGQRSSRLSPSLTESQSVLSAVSVPGTAGAQGDKGKQLNSKELWNLKGSQVERLQQEWAAIEHCRAMKRASEMVQHRLDPMYRISGSNIPLLARYHVNDTEIQRLQEMSETSRILQLDLKRIKYPQGHRSPRRERTHMSKGKAGAGSPQHGEGGEKDEGGAGQNNVFTSPFPHPPGTTHPTSPVSTPEGTPRLPAEEGQGTSTVQGEITQTDDGNHFS